MKKHGHKALTCGKLDYVSAQSDLLCFLDNTTFKNVFCAGWFSFLTCI